MKKMLVMLFFVLAACGQEHATVETPSQEITHFKNTVVWSGSVNTNAELLDNFNKTMSCLRANYIGTLRQGYPIVTFVQGGISCNGGSMSPGCTILKDGIIYIQDDSQWDKIMMFKHEVIHWATFLGNEAHDGPVFMACSPDDPH